ncbi:TetR family transcriptional regulator [Phenylobacterium aquaticum]|uniref:TetR family transcriptional regulator n=1 Tax=Phenylobacterium aquaticum TaxID=1763816 RepID=UPI001F5D27B2|nr:TetR/AcrR family transcriptional regulator [Phenylobacterium aquaticum]
MPEAKASPDPAPDAAAPRPSRRGGKSRAQKSFETRERILDVAEQEFSRHGFDGVTLRTVAKRAKVDTALLHYYFDSKKGLFDAVFLRRAEVLNQDRMEAMDRYESEAGDHVTVEGAVAAFLNPVLERCANAGPGWRAYFALIGVVNNTPVWGGETMTRYFDPVIHRLIKVVKRALPSASETDLFWSYHMLSGSLTLTLAETGRIDTLSGGICRSEDIAAVTPRMIAYAAAGFRAVCKD